jgi:hypothetical protein
MIPKELFEYQNKIKALNPQAQTITYYIGTWRKHLGRNEHLEYLAKYFLEKISRADLFRLAANAGPASPTYPNSPASSRALSS